MYAMPPIIRARPTTPPTTPPAVAPTFFLGVGLAVPVLDCPAAVPVEPFEGPVVNVLEITLVLAVGDVRVELDEVCEDEEVMEREVLEIDCEEEGGVLLG